MEERLTGLEGWDLFGALIAETGDSVEKLIDRADKDPALMQHCLNNTLLPIWEEAWAKMNVEPTLLESHENPNLTYRPLTPQPHLHPFYRLAGVSFYFRGKPQHRELLVKAAQAPYYCFYAQRALTEEYVRLVGKGHSTAAFALLNARAASRVHHAPGFILLAETYFDLATLIQKKSRTQMVDYYSEAYKNMVIADYLQPYCMQSMHNAYQGLGPKISIGIDENSTKEILKKLRHYLQSKDIQVDFNRAKEEGIAFAKEIVDQYYQDSAAREPQSKKTKLMDIFDSESTLGFQTF